MIYIDNNKVKLKNILGIIIEATPEDVLYEIIKNLNLNNIDSFNSRDVKSWTNITYKGTALDDIAVLIEKGYVQKIEKQRYKIIDHPWK